MKTQKVKKIFRGGIHWTGTQKGIEKEGKNVLKRKKGLKLLKRIIYPNVHRGEDMRK